MNIIQALKVWATASPKHRAIAALVLMILFAIIFRLFRHFESFLASPLWYWCFMLGISLLWSYVIYVVNTFQHQGKEIPHLVATPGFSVFSLLVKLVATFIVLVSIGLLLFFHIENWGVEPNLQEQLRAQLVGVAFLLPIGAAYLFCGWIFSNPKHCGWSYFILFPALALYLWNTNYAWHNPINPISAGYEIFYSWVQALPFLPLPILVIPLIIWLFMAGFKLRSLSKFV